MSKESDNIKMLDQLMVEFTKRALQYGCDAVQVLTTVYDEKTGDTQTRNCGNGNWYARKGMIQEFSDEDRARTASFIEHSEFQIDDEGFDFGGDDG
jgi:hypothetical protein